MIQGIGSVVQAIHHFVNLDYVPVARAIKNSYVEQVYEVNAIKTGRFVQSIDWRRGLWTPGQQEFFIDTSRDAFVTYDGYVEFGNDRMQPRYPARRGILAADLGPIFDVMVDDAFHPVFV